MIDITQSKKPEVLYSKSEDDTDGDGYSDKLENELGSDPNNSDKIPPNLIAYYDFENSSKDELTDNSKWKNHGKFRCQQNFIRQI